MLSDNVQSIEWRASVGCEKDYLPVLRNLEELIDGDENLKVDAVLG